MPSVSSTARCHGPSSGRDTSSYAWGERYSPERLDAACRRALSVDLIDVRRLERILVEALEQNEGLYRIEVNAGPGSGVKIINVPAPGPFRESVRYAQGNLVTQAKDLVGDRDPRAHEFTIQLRAFDASRSGSFLGLPALLALYSGLLGKSLKGGLATVGGLNLGGTLDPVHNAVSVAELAVEKGATELLIPISSRRQLNDLSDDMATKLSILYYADAREALLKALGH